MAVATYVDVGVALGRSISTPAEQDQIDWWLNGVEMFIRNRLGPLEDLDAEAVLYVEVEAVAEKARNAARTPESSITVTVDDGNVTRRFENPVTASDITDEWWNLLDPAISTSAWSTQPAFEADTVAWPSTWTGYPTYWVGP